MDGFLLLNFGSWVFKIWHHGVRVCFIFPFLFAVVIADMWGLPL